MTCYPLNFTLRDEARITIRPLAETDLEGLSKFFSKIPQPELDICSYQDTAKVKVVDTESERRKTLELIALDDSEIVGKGAVKPEGNYFLKAVELVLIVTPSYRGRGLGAQMFKLLLAETLNRSIKTVVVRYAHQDKTMPSIIDRYGLKPETVFRQSRKGKQAGENQDIVTSSYNLEDWEGRFDIYRLA